MVQQLLLKETSEGISFNVFIQPRSSKNNIVGFYRDALKIKLTAPPVEGAANRMCIEFLAKQLGVSKSSLSIISGHSSRTKRILLSLDGQTDQQDRQRLKNLLKNLYEKPT
ncbi:MAG TPA: YggU family protein [Deltaproteobacteria bacterium]|nr:YggU family protein [Deltaproteobacteria bacterium]